MKWIRWVSVLVFALLVVGGALAHPLWGDEAETALFGRNILNCGVPCGWDGVNIMGLNDAVVLNKNLINHTSPWGQYYLVALSFRLFGQSAFTARLPFLVLSIVSLGLVYLIVKKLAGKTATVFSLIIMAINVPLILYSFQSRYYALDNFASLVMIWGVLNLMERGLKPKIAVVLGSVFYFYGNYVSMVGFWLALLVFGVIYFRKWSFVKWYLGLGILTAILTAPWYLWLRPFEGRGSLALPVFNVDFVDMLIVLSADFFRAFNIWILLPILWLVYKGKKEVLGLLALVATYAFLMIGLTSISSVDTTFVAERYHTILFGVETILIGLGLGYFWKKQKRVAVVWLVVCLFAVGRFLPKYIKEIIKPYPTPDKVVAEYIEKNAKFGDTAFVSLDRDHEPLIFLLGKKIKFVDRVSLTNKKLFPKNRNLVPRYIWGFREEPDWIIVYSKHGRDGTFLTFDFREVPQGINPQNYDEVVLPVFFADLSRPEVSMRSFEEIKPQYTDQVFIYHRKIK